MNEWTGRLDEVPEDHRPVCSCDRTMRRDHATGVWKCDVHGIGVPTWMPKAEEEPS